MNPYAAVDEIIDFWIKASGSKLFTGSVAEPARFFHLGGTPPYECFQVNIFPPSADRIEVFARAIDTNDNTEFDMQKRWEGPVFELSDMIASALELIEHWKLRPIANSSADDQT